MDLVSLKHDFKTVEPRCCCIDNLQSPVEMLNTHCCCLNILQCPTVLHLAATHAKKKRLRFLRSWDSSRSTPASRNCKCIAITKPSDSLAHFCRKLVYAVYAKNSSSWLNRMCSWQDSHASSFTRSLSRLLPYRLHLSEKVVELLPPNLEEWSRWSKSACLSVGVFYLLHLLGDEYRKNSWDSAFTSKPCTQKKSWGKGCMHMRTSKCQFLHPTTAETSTSFLIKSLWNLSTSKTGSLSAEHTRTRTTCNLGKTHKAEQRIVSLHEAQHIFVFLEYLEDFACGF